MERAALRELMTPGLLRDYAYLTAGAVLVAVAVNMFMEPNKVVLAGIAGVAMLFHYVFHVPVGMTNIVLNVPIFLAGMLWAGGFRFLVRTVYATAVMSFAIDLLAPVLPEVTTDALTYTIFGGLVDGLGTGLVLRGAGSTGGTDIIALILNKYRGISFGSVFLVVNSVILLLGIPVVGLPPVLLALILNYISARVVDVVQEGPKFARTAIIISDRHEAIRQAVLMELRRGATMWEGIGAYTGQSRKVLYTVISRTQVSVLRRIVAAIDPKAFVAVQETVDVMGEGFSPLKPAELPSFPKTLRRVRRVRVAHEEQPSSQVSL